MRYAAIAGLLVLTGCADMPTEADASRADYGRPIAQEECEAIAKATISSALRDPASAQYRFGPCGPSDASAVIGAPRMYGYSLPIEVNGTNAFGGYTGFQRYFVLMRDGQVTIRARSGSYGMLEVY